MTGFTSNIPVGRFAGAIILSITVGSSSVRFNLDRNRSIVLDYYGAMEDKTDWLYNLPLCGDKSVQSLVEEKIDSIEFLSVDRAVINISNGRALTLVHDDITYDLMRFIVDGIEFVA